MGGCTLETVVIEVHKDLREDLVRTIGYFFRTKPEMGRILPMFPDSPRDYPVLYHHTEDDWNIPALAALIRPGTQVVIDRYSRDSAASTTWRYQRDARFAGLQFFRRGTRIYIWKDPA